MSTSTKFIEQSDPIIDSRFATIEHDYDPRWDYEIQTDLLGCDQLSFAQIVMDRLATMESTPFDTGHVHPADLAPSTVGLYCSGTYCEPIVLIDIAAHRDYTPRDIEKTITHEVFHAMQDWSGNPLDEAEAEGWNPFNREEV